jgi:hypothetical protein
MAKKPKQKLLFVDTNILLDFYRSQNDAGLSLLGHLHALHDRIVTTFQVEMEFKKNRHNVIAESFRALKAPETTISPPAFLKEAKTIEVMKRNQKNTAARIARFKKRIRAVVGNPSLKDPVYQTVQTLFAEPTAYNLHRGHPEVGTIKRKAWRRFITGCPPRKKSDNSIGDAINWEWILRCIGSANKDVVIVSRDGDYGTALDDVVFANFWLAHEVKRINQQRRILVFDRLSAGLKELNVKVSAAEESEEDELAEKGSLAAAYIPPSAVPVSGISGYSGVTPTTEFASQWSTLVNPLEEYRKRLKDSSTDQK